MTVGEKGVRKRRPQERAEITKRKLIDVAIKEFSKRGFDAVTVRDIEIKASVQRNLVRYHFGSKKELWKAAAGAVHQQLMEHADRRQGVLKDLSSDRERLIYSIRSFVRFCAQHPEVKRLLLEEATRDSWRSEWLVENQVKPAMHQIKALASAELGISDEEFLNWYYLLVGGSAMIFSLAPEAKLLFGVDTHSEEVVNRHADLMVNVLLLKRNKP